MDLDEECPRQRKVEYYDQFGEHPFLQHGPHEMWADISYLRGEGE